MSGHLENKSSELDCDMDRTGAKLSTRITRWRRNHSFIAKPTVNSNGDSVAEKPWDLAVERRACRQAKHDQKFQYRNF